MISTKLRRRSAILAGAVAALAFVTNWGTQAAQSQNNTIAIDGSSTVFPITEAVAEEFQASKRGAVRVTVGISGTGGGFKKFCNGELDISNASRPIKESEQQACAAKGIEYVELPVAYDALTVVVNPRNTWAASMTTAELKAMWEGAAEGKITKWSQVRPGWPDVKFTLFGPGADSGTFDYFNEVILGKDNKSRTDYTPSEDDNVLVQGVSRDQNALGYFGFAYYDLNKSRVKAVAIDSGKGAVMPAVATVNDGTYKPLSRPIYIYVKKSALDRPEVREFSEFYLKNATRLVREVDYVPLPDADYRAATQRLSQREVGRKPLRAGL